jgi:dCTP deaminase
MTEGGVLTGPEIRKEIYAGGIVIDPFNEDHVNPASYDLTLGAQLAVYKRPVYLGGGTKRVLGVPPSEQIRHTQNCRGSNICAVLDVIDSKVSDDMEVHEFTIGESGWVLRPGVGYLMHTAERVTTKRFVPVLDGKSSIGRLFVAVHVTAGYGDPGFDGQYTLEVVVTHPVIVYPGMRIAQMRFHTMVGEFMDYQLSGHYTGQASMGPVPSKAHSQFKKC